MATKSSIRVYHEGGEVFRVNIDNALALHISKKMNRMGMKRKLGSIFRKAFTLRISCPNCRDEIGIVPEMYGMQKCPGCKCYALIIPDFIPVLRSDDIYVRKVSSFRVVFSRNDNGKKKIGSMRAIKGVGT